MRISKRQITSTFLLAGIPILATSIDLINPDKPIYFDLTPNFRSIIQKIKLSDSRLETLGSLESSCVENDLMDLTKRTPKEFYFNRNDSFTLDVNEDSRRSIFITVDYIGKFDSDLSDPVIIIKPNNDKASICQDDEHYNIETFNFGVEKDLRQFLVPRGSYSLWIGDYKDIKNPYYRIKIKEDLDS